MGPFEDLKQRLATDKQESDAKRAAAQTARRRKEELVSEHERAWTIGPKGTVRQALQDAQRELDGVAGVEVRLREHEDDFIYVFKPHPELSGSLTFSSRTAEDERHRISIRESENHGRNRETFHGDLSPSEITHERIAQILIEWMDIVRSSRIG
jgi:hypothetical protein